MRLVNRRSRRASYPIAAGVALLAVLTLGQNARACTAFCQQSGEIVLAGKNYDWHLDHGLLIVNKKGIMKRAMLMDFSDKAAVWMISINTPHTGLLNPHFANYDPDVNRWLLFYTTRHTPQIAEMPPKLIDALARYPETAFAK